MQYSGCNSKFFNNFNLLSRVALGFYSYCSFVLADVNLASDTFHRSFTDVIATTAQTAGLPDMQGSGNVRDLRQAASLSTAEGATLASALSQFSVATHSEQRSQLDALLSDWAANDGIFSERMISA